MISNKRKITGLRRMTTAEYAASQFVKPQSVRKQHSLTGSYLGVVPEKLKNGRLAWSVECDDRKRSMNHSLVAIQ